MLLHLSKVKKTKVRSNFFLWSFLIILCLWLLCFASMIGILFWKTSDGLNLKDGERLYFGFYKIIVGTPNAGYLNWTAIVAGILIWLTVSFMCLSYWCFRNSRYSVYIEKAHLYCLYIFIGVSLILLFLVNLFNRPLVEYKNLDLVSQGWNIHPEIENYVLNLNYVYDIQIINTANGTSAVNLQNGAYMSLWVSLITIFFIIIITTLVILLYNSFNYFRL